MKNILLFLLFSASLSAQTITKSFVVDSTGIYYEVTTTTQDDGSFVTTGARVGPAASLAADQADKIQGRIAALAASAYVVSFTSKRLKEEAQADSAIITLTALSPLKVIQERHLADLLTPGWTIKNGGAEQTLVFTQNAQGVLRYSINGAATKQARMYGSIIRLLNYPSSPTDTDFFLDESGRKYFSLPNRAVVIKKP